MIFKKTAHNTRLCSQAGLFEKSEENQGRFDDYYELIANKLTSPLIGLMNTINLI